MSTIDAITTGAFVEINAASAIEPHQSPNSLEVRWATRYDGILCTSNLVDGELVIDVPECRLTAEAAQRLVWAIQHALQPVSEMEQKCC